MLSVIIGCKGVWELPDYLRYITLFILNIEIVQQARNTNGVGIAELCA